MAAAALSTRPWLAALALPVAVAAALGYSHVARAHSAAPEIRRVVKTYEVAIMTGDGETACAKLTASARRELIQSSSAAGMGSSCREVGASMKRYIDYLVSQAPSPARASEARRMIEDPPVEVRTIHGDSATAKVDDISEHPIPLIRTDDGWKIAGFALPDRPAAAG